MLKLVKDNLLHLCRSKQLSIRRLHSNWAFLFVTSNALHVTEDDSATQEEKQQIEKVLDVTAVDAGKSAAKSQGLLVELASHGKDK